MYNIRSTTARAHIFGVMFPEISRRGMTIKCNEGELTLSASNPAVIAFIDALRRELEQPQPQHNTVSF